MTRVEEIAKYLSQSPLLADGVTDMIEQEWVGICKAARLMLLHRQKEHKEQMARLYAPIKPARIVTRSKDAPYRRRRKVA